jgi:hypothetical protein
VTGDPPAGPAEGFRTPPTQVAQADLPAQVAPPAGLTQVEGAAGLTQVEGAAVADLTQVEGAADLTQVEGAADRGRGTGAGLGRALLALVLAGLVALAAPAVRAADDGVAQARSHYEMGLKLFDAREHEQALIEFERANELKPRPAALFMMAQCEYLLGRLKDARGHYLRYATENPDGEFASLARDRVESIDKRKSTFVVNTVPEDVTVSITDDAAGTKPEPVIVGQAPNNFQVPRGRYRIDVSKPNYQGQTRIVDIDIAETKPLFFKLDPIPARLEIETVPFGATLYVNGNRARNPYNQQLAPGRVEIFAEAPNYDSQTTDLMLVAGEHRVLTGANRLRLSYVQRSGRPELLFASAAIGTLVGAAAVAAAIGPDLSGPHIATVLLVGGGGVAGGVAGAVIATPLVPAYIPDNRALFILGTTWIGAAEGALAGTLYHQIAVYNRKPTVTTLDPNNVVDEGCLGPDPCRPPLGDQLRAWFVGSLPGFAFGIGIGAATAKYAPTYGRVLLIQSAALGGALTGALMQVALQWKPYGDQWAYTHIEYYKGGEDPPPKDGRTASGEGCGVNEPCATRTTSILDLAPGALIGLNVGLAAGLLGAYLPDQSRYGPSWRRVLLVDLAAVSGAMAAGVGACVALVDDCLRAQRTSEDARAIAAGAALVGGGLGILGGFVLTRHFDQDQPASASTASRTPLPMATLVPMRTATGDVVPALAALGTF